MNKPDLLSETDKYFLEPGDFTQQLDKFIFSAIYNLYVNGAEQIHAVDIDTYLQQNALAKQLMEKENGKSLLQDCEIESDVSNFNYYYNKLKKHAFYYVRSYARNFKLLLEKFKLLR